MKTNEHETQKLERQNSWQQAKHVNMYSDLLQAERGNFDISEFSTNCETRMTASVLNQDPKT